MREIFLFLTLTAFYFLCMKEIAEVVIFSCSASKLMGINASPFTLPESFSKSADNYHSTPDGGLSGPFMWQIRERANKLGDRHVMPFGRLEYEERSQDEHHQKKPPKSFFFFFNFLTYSDHAHAHAGRIMSIWSLKGPEWKISWCWKCRNDIDAVIGHLCVAYCSPT